MRRFPVLQKEGREVREKEAQLVWTGVEKGWGEGPPTLPDSSVTDFACRLPPPTRRPLLLPPLAWLLSRESLGSWCSCPSHGRPPAGALTDESLLPRWGQARKGVEGGRTRASEGWSPAKPPSWVSNSSPRIWGRGAVSRQTAHGPGSQGGWIPIPSLHDSP